MKTAAAASTKMFFLIVFFLFSFYIFFFLLSVILSLLLSLFLSCTVSYMFPLETNAKIGTLSDSYKFPMEIILRCNFI